jgi:hypothetical protein
MEAAAAKAATMKTSTAKAATMAAAATTKAATTVAASASAPTTASAAARQRHRRRCQANGRNRQQRDNRFTQHIHSPSEFAPNHDALHMAIARGKRYGFGVTVAQLCARRLLNSARAATD